MESPWQNAPAPWSPCLLLKQPCSRSSPHRPTHTRTLPSRIPTVLFFLFFLHGTGSGPWNVTGHDKTRGSQWLSVLGWLALLPSIVKRYPPPPPPGSGGSKDHEETRDVEPSQPNPRPTNLTNDRSVVITEVQGCHEAALSRQHLPNTLAVHHPLLLTPSGCPGSWFSWTLVRQLLLHFCKLHHTLLTNSSLCCSYLELIPGV